MIMIMIRAFFQKVNKLRKIPINQWIDVNMSIDDAHNVYNVHAINNILLAVWLYTGKLQNSYSIIVFGRFGLSKPQKSLQMAIKQCANHTIVSLTIKLLWLQTTLSVLELC